MNSKYNEKNSKLVKFLHDEDGRGTRDYFQPDLFSEIDFKEYDYLVLNEDTYGDSLEFRFGTEKVKVSRNPFKKDRYYVEHEGAFNIKGKMLDDLGITKEDIIKEMVSLKHKEISFEDSIFYSYYMKDMEVCNLIEQEKIDLSGLKKELQGFNQP